MKNNEYRVIRKDGKGTVLYIKKSDIFKSGLVDAHQMDGFITKINLDEYTIIK